MFGNNVKALLKIMVKAVSDSPSVHSQSVSLSPRDSKILDTGHLKVF